MIAGLRIVPYSRGLLVVCEIVADYGNPKPTLRPSHTNMMEALREGAANGALENIPAGVASVHDKRSSSVSVSKTSPDRIVTCERGVRVRRGQISCSLPYLFRETMSKSASTSFVFANAKGELGHIVTQLKRVSNIESVTPVTGRFDLVIRLKTNEPIKAFNTVEKIRSITGITSTQTAFSIENVSNAKNREESSEPPLAYALVKVKGKFRTVLQKLKSFPNLVEAHLIPGEFDVVASFNGFSQDELMENSVEKISRINGVTASETLITWTPTNRP